MGKELARSARALGRDMNFFGDKEKDLVLQTKGRIKINFGDKFTELFNGSKFCTSDDAIRSTTGRPSTTDPDGLYFDEETGTLYLKWRDQIFEIFSNAQSQEGFISYTSDQTLTGEERNTAKYNIGAIFDTATDAINSGTEGVVFITNENKAYILHNGQLYPITNNTEVELPSDEEDNYYFDKTVTIDISQDGSALIIEGLNKYITIGEGTNITNIYQGDDGLVIESPGITINVDGDEVITINNGKIDIDSIVNALKGIITDEIYSSNFIKYTEGDKQGWGIWIDKSTGESYLQVDHIITDQEITYEKITYKDALELIADSKVKLGAYYVMVDFQNEWEDGFTYEFDSEDLYLGTEHIGSDFFPAVDSIDPSKYEEGEGEPKFGLDRKVRPLLLTGKNEESFNEDVIYFYKGDSKDVIRMLYDIKGEDYIKAYLDSEENGTDFDSETFALTNKGRIYYMEDSWYNEGSCDFKHYQDANGKWMFNSPNNEDLSSLNTVDDVVCSNNKLLDPTVRIADTINIMSITGQRINNNTFTGKFINSTLGSNTSIIENNSFAGELVDCNLSGIIRNNIIVSKIDNTTFNGELSYNEFKKDIIDSSFTGNVLNNIFNAIITECTFGAETSSNFLVGELSNSQFNQGILNSTITGNITDCTFTEILQNNNILANLDNCQFNLFSYNSIKGSMTDCESTNEFRENNITGDWSGCVFNNTFYNNNFNVAVVENCTFNGATFANTANSDLWSDNEFNGDTKYNIFQANVESLVVEDGPLNNNQFFGRIDDVTFRQRGTGEYGINNNIINGLFSTSTINVDFSHNTITGPINDLIISPGIMSDQTSNSIFNYNDIKAASIGTITINGDFRRNTIKAEFFGSIDFNGYFLDNKLSYFNMRFATYNNMKSCIGSGDTFIGDFDADFTNCEFGTIQNCTFRGEPIKFAKFRNDFAAINFDSNENITDLDKLYDEQHQVDIYRHLDNITVICNACNAAFKGEIRMFSGLESEIPEGWHICDGTEGTPNLIDKFIKASRVAGEEGGNTELVDGGLTLTEENIPAHTHEASLRYDYLGSGIDYYVATDKNQIIDFVVDKGGSSNYCLYTGEKGGENYQVESFTNKMIDVFDRTTVSIESSGGSVSGGEVEPIQIEPPYYTLIFIMKL